MTERWWIAVAAGVVLGLGGVVAVETATDEASAQSGFTLSREQLRTNQKISIAAVKRVNKAQKDIAALGAAAPLYAVSSGAVGSNLIRGRGAVSSQVGGEGQLPGNVTPKIRRRSGSATVRDDGPPIPAGGPDPPPVRTADRGPTQPVGGAFPGKRKGGERRVPPQVVC